MTLIVDAAPLVALADRRDPYRGAVRDVLAGETGTLVVPAPVTAEVDYLLGRRVGRDARLAFLNDLAAGRFSADGLRVEDYGVIIELEERYAALDLGLADCAVVVLAKRHATRRLLTFDHRHFRTVQPLQGGTFELLPQNRSSQQ